MASSNLGLINALLANSYRFEINRSKDRQFYWTLHNTVGNTEPFAQSETYTSKQSCLESIERVRSNAARATIKDNA